MNTERQKFRILNVAGHLWCGVEASHEYTLRDDQNVTTLAEAKRVAGDFESLDSAEVVTVDRIIVEEVAIQPIP